MPHKSKGNKSGGASGSGSGSTSTGVVTILNDFAFGQVISSVTFNGTTILNVKWAGFEDGNAIFVNATGGIIVVPVDKITAITL